jgi:hypothetical protein
MTLKQGWINRQFARVENESKSWPSWMLREPEQRSQSKETTRGHASKEAEPKKAPNNKESEST